MQQKNNHKTVHTGPGRVHYQYYYDDYCYLLL